MRNSILRQRTKCDSSNKRQIYEVLKWYGFGLFRYYQKCKALNFQVSLLSNADRCERTCCTLLACNPDDALLARIPAIDMAL